MAEVPKYGGFGYKYRHKYMLKWYGNVVKHYNFGIINLLKQLYVGNGRPTGLNLGPTFVIKSTLLLHHSMKLWNKGRTFELYFYP